MSRMVASCRLTVVHAGVYALGPQPLSPVGKQSAALMAIGPDPLLSHQSSGAHQDLVTPSGIVHVSISTRVRRRLRGVVVHRPRRIDPEDRTHLNGIPMTAVPRTLLDLAGMLDLSRLEKAVEAADRKGDLDPVAIHGVIEALPRPPGMQAAEADHRIVRLHPGCQLGTREGFPAPSRGVRPAAAAVERRGRGFGRGLLVAGGPVRRRTRQPGMAQDLAGARA